MQVVQVASAAMTIYGAEDGGWGASTVYLIFNPVVAERYLKVASCVYRHLGAFTDGPIA